MSSECLAFSAIPHSTRLFVDYVSDFSRVREFYARPPSPLDWLPEQARSLHYDQERRQAVAAVLERQNRTWGASAKTLESITRLRAGAAAAVTGQQVTLFGGPLFSILKAMTAVRIAQEATREGVDCVPVFWLATEDHDLAEVNHAALPAAEGGLRVLTTESHGIADAPMSTVKLGPEINAVVKAATDLLGDSQISELLAASYRPGETLGSAFAKLFAGLFADWGVILLDASDAELHRIASPVYRAAALASGDLTQALLDRGKALQAAGYHEQVKVTPSSTLLFTMVNGARVPIHRRNGQFTAGEKGNKREFSETALVARIREAPENFSANVLLRPVVQDYLLPTLAYNGGAAEVAYFAQAAVVYQELLGRVTPVLPRLSATLVESREKQLMEKYRLALPDLFHGPEHLREIMAARSLPAQLESDFEQAEAALDAALEPVKANLAQLDPTLVDAARKASAKMHYQLKRLHARAARAQLRRSDEVARHAERLATALYPNKTLQERQLTGIYFLARYGLGLLARFRELAEVNCPGHQVVWL